MVEKSDQRLSIADLDVGLLVQLGSRADRSLATSAWFVEAIELLTSGRRGDEFNGLVRRGIVDAGHGLVGFLVRFLSTPLRVEPAY